MFKSFKAVSLKWKLIFVIAFMAVIISEGIIFTNSKIQNNKIKEYVQLSVRPPLNGDNKAFVILSKNSTFSEAENTYSSVYEGRFVNRTKQDFSNWSIEISVPENCNLRSFWNAEMSKSESSLFVKPNTESIKTVKSGETLAFGFILDGQEDIEIKNLRFMGTMKQKIFLNPAFIINTLILFILIIILITILIMQRFMMIQIEMLKQQKERDNLLIDQTMKTFVQFIDAKDEYTRGHSARVAKYAQAIAKQMGYDEKFQIDMYHMGLMHDIGKLAVPDDILNKTTKLSSDEWEVIQLHTTNGARMLKDFSIMPELKDAVLYHHERYDGKGYVNQLKGEAIPLCARIICVADSYDAMNTNRCYRLRFSKERIICEIERCSGKQFDPKIVPAMVELIRNGTIEKL